MREWPIDGLVVSRDVYTLSFQLRLGLEQNDSTGTFEIMFCKHRALNFKERKMHSSTQ